MVVTMGYSRQGVAIGFWTPVMVFRSVRKSLKTNVDVKRSCPRCTS
jgi:hypothetical protein